MKLLRLPLDKVVCRPQVRRTFDPVSLARLADNIRAVGQQQPILVRFVDGAYVVIDGERRCRALQLLNAEEILVYLVEDATAIADILARQLSCNLQREDLNVVERAEGIYNLMQHTQRSAEQTASDLGLSTGTVSRTLRIRILPASIKADVAAGRISADAAYRLARIESSDRQADLAKRVADGELTRDGLAAELKQPSLPRPAKPREETWRMTRTIAPKLAITVSGAISLEQVITAAEAFLAKAKEACRQGIPLAQFLSEFKHSAEASAEGAE